MSDNTAAPGLVAGSRQAPWTPLEDREKEAVREQVGRIISSALFRNSKRFPVFLRYTVEHALEPRESLKERTIGHDVFGRDADYDTAQDPIVRITAAEVRKRLTQYYQSPDHAAEPIVAYQPGSYVPEFARPLGNEPAGPAPDTLDDDPRPNARGTRRWRVPVLAAAAVVAATLVLALATMRGGARTVVDRFWAPLVASASPVLLCIGDPFSAGDTRAGARSVTEATIEEFLQANSVRYTDSVTLALLTGELRARQKPFRIRRPAATELKDLREGPVILIGGFNNPWTLKLSEGLRFTLASDGNGSYVRDRDRPDNRDWQIGTRFTRLKDVSRTFGLIARVKDPATGHSVLTLSGLMLGTRAAGECVLDVSCLASATQSNPGWDTRNLQIVVSAAVIGEDSGAPRVVATHSW